MFFTAGSPEELLNQVRECIAVRNRPMLYALELCIEQLELLSRGDDDVQCALRCARKAVALERGFQNRS